MQLRDKPVNPQEEITLMACLTGAQPDEIHQYAYVVEIVKNGVLRTAIGSRCSHNSCTHTILSQAVALTELSYTCDEEDGGTCD
jgi:hypothetical protein